jgi:hypothetical protein
MHPLRIAAVLVFILIGLPFVLGAGTPGTPVVWQKGAPAPRTEAAEEKASTDRATMEATWSSARASWALLIVAVAQLGFFVWQLRMMQRSIDVAAEASRAALASVETVARAERAYVFGKAIWGPSSRESDGTVPITLEFVNRGKTPAMITMLRGYPIVSKRAPEALVAFPGEDARLPDGLTIAADRGFAEPMPLKVTDDEWRDIQLRNTNLYVVGLIEYRDIHDVLHQTGICWVLDFVRGFQMDRHSGLNFRT